MIKSSYINDYKLSEVDKIVNIEKPYFQYLLFIFNGLNYTYYIIDTQFKNDAVQYNNDTYEYSLNKNISEAQSKCKPNEESEAKLHKGLIDTYKNDKTEGSCLISILNKVDLFSFLIPDDLSNKEQIILEENQFFNKSFKNINFTKQDLYNGFSQLIYWNYAQADYKSYKQIRIKINKEKRQQMSIMNLPLVTKERIAKDVYYLFNNIFGEDTITPIRPITLQPKILKYYDDIPIYTTKDITHLEKDFFEFISKIIFDKRKTIKDFTKDNYSEVYKSTCSLRAFFY